MLAVGAWVLTTCCAQLSAQDAVNGEQLAKALATWQRRYETGGLELEGFADASSRARSLYRVIEERVGMTHFDGLEAMLGAALETPGEPDLVRSMVRLAAVEVEITRRPDVVRAAAISTLGQLTATSDLWILMQTAAGVKDGWSRWHAGLQSAAVRGLGASTCAAARPTIEKQCACADARVRFAAAEALASIGRPASLDVIARRLGVEESPRAMAALLRSALALLTEHRGRCDIARVRETALAACAAIGKTDWRADFAAVELLDEFRTEAAVEPLVQILERFHQDPEAVGFNKLSGILRHRAHAVLESLTGARIPASEPTRWREFWEDARDGFVLAPTPPRTEGRTSSGFFGIPIVGMRVVFVIDRSGSMVAQHRDDDGNARTRFQLAREEVLRAVRSLAPDTQFNVVVFSDRVKTWRSGFAAPTTSNIAALEQRLAHTPVIGGTDIHGALERALSIGVTKPGARYESPVDEIFLLSDGAPSVGRIIDPNDIRAVVGERNRHRGVRINTVFIGGGESDFMRQLAADHGGRYAQL